MAKYIGINVKLNLALLNKDVSLLFMLFLFNCLQSNYT